MMAVNLSIFRNPCPTNKLSHRGVGHIPMVTGEKQQMLILKKIDLIVVNGRKEMFYLTTHSTHFIYGYMASDIW